MPAAAKSCAVTHVYTWKINVDVNERGRNRATIWRHEPIPNVRLGAVANTTMPDRAEIVTKERGIPWDPANFTTLSITDPGLLNKQGKPSGYQLLPSRYGNARYGGVDDYTYNDIWVTLQNPTHVYPSMLNSYIASPRDVDGHDLEVWYTAAMHHMIRSEDGVIQSRQPVEGVTQVMWTGFMLMPQDLFDTSPLYSPVEASPNAASRAKRR